MSFDIKRLQEALESPSIEMPRGLGKEGMRLFIKKSASLDKTPSYLILDVANSFSRLPSGLSEGDGLGNLETFLKFFDTTFKLLDVVVIDFSNVISVGSQFLRGLCNYIKDNDLQSSLTFIFRDESDLNKAKNYLSQPNVTAVYCIFDVDANGKEFLHSIYQSKTNAQDVIDTVFNEWRTNPYKAFIKEVTYVSKY